MKATVNKTLLFKALAEVIKAIAAKPVIPVMSNILLELDENGIIHLTGSDGDALCIKSSLKAESFSDPGITTVPAKLLTDLVKTLPEEPVTLETGEATLLVKWQTGESELPIIPSDDFICIKCPEDIRKVELNSDTLIAALSKTVAYAATDATRPVLTGVFFDFASGESNIVASDSHRLAMYNIKTPAITNACSFILPVKAGAAIKSLLPKDTAVVLTFDDNAVRINYNENEILSRLIVGKFPKYRDIIPNNNDKEMTINRDTLVNALQRMGLMSTSSMIAKMDITFNILKLEANDYGRSTRATETLECDYDANNLTIGVKVSTLINTLTGIESENVVLAFSDPKRAILVMPDEQAKEKEPLTALVMPMALTS